MSINSTGSTLDFTPNRTGDISVAIRVSDGAFDTYQNFTITVLQGNRPPEFRSVPVTTAFVEWPYVYNASAYDQETDKLNYSLESGPEGMTVDASSGKVAWRPKSTGNFSCVLKAADGRGGLARQEFSIRALDAVKPSVKLEMPYSGETLKGKVFFSGTVTKGTRDVLSVQFRVDGEDWRNAPGTYKWNLTLDTKSLRDGMHTFEFRAFDGVEYSDFVSTRFKVDNSDGKTGFIPMTDGAALLLVAITSVVLAMMKRRVNLEHR